MEKSSILNVLAAEVRQGKLIFPASVSAVMNARKMLNDPECDLDAIIRLIQMEPLLSTKIVAVANSAIFNLSGRRITDIRSAVTLLGFNTIRNLATAIVVQQLAGSQQNNEKVAQLWEHSVHVATLARVLAEQVTGQNPDTAMFAGLIHEISWFYLLSRKQQYPDLIDENLAGNWSSDSDMEQESELECEITIGTAILNALSVPAPVTESIICLWEGYLASPPDTLGDTLLFANYLAAVSSPFILPSDQTGDDIAASIAALVDPETLSRIRQQAEKEAASLIADLH